MRIRFALFALLAITLLTASVSLAAMTIYFKDGTSRSVHRIEFQGKTAELTMLDGSTVTVPSDSIDLASSGIAAPEGAYGGQKLTGRKTTTTRGSLFGDESKRQEQLKEEWRLATQSAVAIGDVGNIRKGDNVKIVSRTEDKPAPEPESRSKRRNYTTYYEPEPVATDDAYVVLYKNPDGTFAKRLFDAAAFAEKFRIIKKETPVAQLPMPMPEDGQGTPAQEPAPEKDLAPPPSFEPVVSQPSKEEPVVQEKPKTPSRPMSPAVPVAVIVVLIAAGATAAILLKKRTVRPFVDTSRFKQYEDELRDFEVEIWLKHGKTMDQLMDICVKKFYQDNPAALAVAQKAARGGEKSTILALIRKNTGTDAQGAEGIYADFQTRIRGIRTLIDQVSARTGKRPASAVPSPAASPAPAAAPRAPVPPVVATRTAQTAPAAAPPPQPQPAAAPLAPPAASADPPPLPDISSVDSSGVPLYLQDLLHQLGFLTHEAGEAFTR